MPTLDGRAVRALIFDLDGLLVDSEPVWFEVEGGFLARLGHTWTRADAESCMGQGTPNTLRLWRERFGVEVDLERDTERILDGVIARAASIPLKPGAQAILEWAALRRLPMAVASSSRHRLIEAVLAAKGIRPYFTTVVSGQDVRHGKPAPDVFLLAASRLGLPPEDCVVLEDAVAGATGAVAAGAQLLVVPSSPDPRFEALGARMLASLGEVPALLTEA